MPKILDVDKARRILPTNAAPGVAELNSNFTTYIAEVNPSTAGDTCEPVDCGSVAEVAAAFKPEIEFQIQKVSDLGSEQPTTETESVNMRYGEEPSQIMNDFSAENLVVKSKTREGERTLLDQQLAYHALEDLQERLKDQKFTALFDTNREAMIQSLESEIERIQSLLGEIDLEALDQ